MGRFLAAKSKEIFEIVGGNGLDRISPKGRGSASSQVLEKMVLLGCLQKWRESLP